MLVKTRLLRRSLRSDTGILERIDISLEPCELFLYPMMPATHPLRDMTLFDVLSGSDEWIWVSHGMVREASFHPSEHVFQSRQTDQSKPKALTLPQSNTEAPLEDSAPRTDAWELSC